MVYVAEEVIAIDLCLKKAMAESMSSPRVTGAIMLAWKLTDSYMPGQANLERKDKGEAKYLHQSARLILDD